MWHAFLYRMLTFTLLVLTCNKRPLVVHTVIVDECGCTPESSTALLLKLAPSNLILVGDHKQLPPCSMLPPQELVGTGHSRSLLERCVLSSGTVHRLAEQYRMPGPICRVVSKLFYRNMLTTPARLAQAKAKAEPRPLVWLRSVGRETVPPGQTSTINPEQVTMACGAAALLRAKHPKATICILSFYKGPCLSDCVVRLRFECAQRHWLGAFETGLRVRPWLSIYHCLTFIR